MLKLRIHGALLPLAWLIACGGAHPAPAPAPAKVALPDNPAEKPKTPPPAPVVAPPTPPARGPLLWQVGGSPGSWLIGTIHAGVTLADAPAAVRAAFTGCRKLIIESDIANPDLAAGKALMGRAGKERTDRLIGKQRWRKLVRMIPGANPGALKRMRPWVLYMMLAVKMMPAGTSLDRQLLDAAKDRRMAVGFLESTVAPLRILAGLPDAPMARQLGRLVDDPVAVRDDMSRLVGAFKAGDAGRLTRLTFDSPEARAFPAMNDRFIIGRNRAWLPGLVSELQKGGVCVAVGVGHLLGKRSLQVMLRKHGFNAARYRGR